MSSGPESPKDHALERRIIAEGRAAHFGGVGPSVEEATMDVARLGSARSRKRLSSMGPRVRILLPPAASHTNLILATDRQPLMLALGSAFLFGAHRGGWFFTCLVRSQNSSAA